APEEAASLLPGRAGSARDFPAAPSQTVPAPGPRRAARVPESHQLSDAASSCDRARKAFGQPTPRFALSGRRTLRLLFFLSGAVALAYEVLWSKWLTQVIGITTFSVSTVVAAFLTGLALGGVFFGRSIDRRGNALRLYASLEAGVAV